MAGFTGITRSRVLDVGGVDMRNEKVAGNGGGGVSVCV